MELGNFSVSLKVKDIQQSKTFYESLGFKAIPECGSVKDKWLIMDSGDSTSNRCLIGLFEGMLEQNLLTFNPSDARAIEAHLKQAGTEPKLATKGSEGPTHFIVEDPDGNRLMFDQF